MSVFYTLVNEVYQYHSSAKSNDTAKRECPTILSLDSTFL